MTRVLIIWKVHLVQVQITGTASFNLPGIRMGDDYIAATPQPLFLFFKGYNKVVIALWMHSVATICLEKEFSLNYSDHICLSWY